MNAILASFLICALTADTEPNSLAWPQFRGPQGSGVADTQKPPVEFGPNKNVKWRTAIPGGFSSPIVAGENLVLTAFENNKLYTIAYNRGTGKEAWRVEAPAKQIERFQQSEGSPAASTPATDGTRIVSYFGSCGLFCYDLAGHELWRHTMPTAATAADFGTGVSPVIADGAVVLVRDENKTPQILALDLESGKVRWERKRDPRPGFCTPVICDAPEGKQIVVPGYNRMVGYDFRTGAEVWSVSGMPSVACASPVVVDRKLYFAGWSPGEDFKLPPFDDFLKAAGQEKLGYITREGFDRTEMKGFFDNQDADHDGKLTREEWDGAIAMLSAAKNSAFALKLGGVGDVTKSHVIWRQTKGLPYVPSGIVYRGQYVMVKDGGLVTAYDAGSGKVLYAAERVGAPGKYYASPVAANGHIYFTCIDTGAVTVVKAGTSKPEVVAKNPKFNERIAATPVLADNCIYVRTEQHLYAFEAKK